MVPRIHQQNPTMSATQPTCVWKGKYVANTLIEFAERIPHYASENTEYMNTSTTKTKVQNCHFPPGQVTFKTYPPQANSTCTIFCSCFVSLWWMAKQFSQYPVVTNQPTTFDGQKARCTSPAGNLTDCKDLEAGNDFSCDLSPTHLSVVTFHQPSSHVSCDLSPTHLSPTHLSVVTCHQPSSPVSCDLSPTHLSVVTCHQPSSPVSCDLSPTYLSPTHLSGVTCHQPSSPVVTCHQPTCHLWPVTNPSVRCDLSPTHLSVVTCHQPTCHLWPVTNPPVSCIKLKAKTEKRSRACQQHLNYTYHKACLCESKGGEEWRKYANTVNTTQRLWSWAHQQNLRLTSAQSFHTTQLNCVVSCVWSTHHTFAVWACMLETAWVGVKNFGFTEEQKISSRGPLSWRNSHVCIMRVQKKMAAWRSEMP